MSFLPRYISETPIWYFFSAEWFDSPIATEEKVKFFQKLLDKALSQFYDPNFLQSIYVNYVGDIAFERPVEVSERA